jgi:UDP-N-acetylglucosamine 2-epimerase (non-hydrolysing)
MQEAIRVDCVVGTRPEAIKMAPVVLRLRSEGSGFSPRLIATGQHGSVVTDALAHFGLQPELDLGALIPGQSLAELSARLLVRLDVAFQQARPRLVLAQGDTTSVFCAAIAAHYQKIPLGHVEAGLRTGRPYAPFPEEKNRVVASHLAAIHFAPTENARNNLLREGIAPDSIHVTGNTVIDALLLTLAKNPTLPLKPPTRRFILVTAHRRENWSDMDEIASALAELVTRNSDLGVVFPVHPNPAISDVIARRLGNLDRVRLLAPVAYPQFVALLRSCHLVLTDSGGMQEEAPALGKPVLVMREATERPEAIEAGTAMLVGPRRGAIVQTVETLWRSRAAHERVARVANPYGDGQAAERIHGALNDMFSGYVNNG